jgi:outer membrane protein assembly factor BamB
MFFCIDLDTMELVWAQDTRDDSNSSPVIERVAKDEAYIYTAPSLHWTQNANANGTIYIYKLNAITGEIVWQTPYQVHTVNLLSGGVQSTPVLGKPGSSIEGFVIYSISRIPDVYTGVMVALDTKTGEEIWRLDMANYTWSSPVAFYEEDGTAYIAVCDSVGDVTLVEGATGKVLDTASVGSLVEASPAVYEDMLIIGTRGMLICGVQIK